mmetsp:Transcript_528/g.1180  ORF Transcript_528/g.1180 Transcript_528/m.1180 type:complete len:113 (+) Transcript_528:2097-2435(+)
MQRACSSLISFLLSFLWPLLLSPSIPSPFSPSLPPSLPVCERKTTTQTEPLPIQASHGQRAKQKEESSSSEGSREHQAHSGDRETIVPKTEEERESIKKGVMRGPLSPPFPV